MKYIDVFNVYMDAQPKLNMHKTYMLCIHWESCIYLVQVVLSISGNIITIILGWITSFVINNEIKSNLNDNERSNIEI